MAYIRVDRKFRKIEEQDDPGFTDWRYWSKEVGGWLEWEDLLLQSRVVVLAEAGSGKTTEFQEQAELLRSEEKFALFLPLEDLVTSFAPESCLESETVLQDWENNHDIGYFFLDSVDELKTTRKSLRSALRNFRNRFEDHLQRCHVYLSSRPSEWKGEADEREICKLLGPRLAPARKTQNLAPADLLLEVFAQEDETWVPGVVAETPSTELVVVKLLPLDHEMGSHFAEELGIFDVKAFGEALYRQALEALAERPRDLVDLVEYWKIHGVFESFQKMTETAVNRKLLEENQDRKYTEPLSDTKAREGAEMLAAALTFGKTFSLRAPQDGSIFVENTLDPEKLLPEWTPIERLALLRRAVFAPETHGKIRFHHRNTQEYLAAQYLWRLHQKGLPKEKTFRLLFSDTFGIRTLVPSLRPVAAWLALEVDEIREEILRREPLVLLQHGDPGSLPLASRKILIHQYAKKHTRGEVSDTKLDREHLRLFAHKDLSKAVLNEWDHCDRYDFREHLLWIIKFGKLTECHGLLTSVLTSLQEGYTHVVLAVEALVRCGCDTILRNFSRKLFEKRASIDRELVIALACHLFPKYLSVNEVFEGIRSSMQPEENRIVLYRIYLEPLWSNCPPPQQNQFLQELCRLSSIKPHIGDWEPVSEQFKPLVEHYDLVAHTLLLEKNTDESPELVRLLMSIERCRSESYREKLKPPLTELLRKKSSLKQKLFWADAEEHLSETDGSKSVISVHRIKPPWNCLLELDEEDLDWLFADLENLSSEPERCLLVDAIFIASEGKNQKAALERLREKIRQEPQLLSDLDRRLQPETPDWKQKLDTLERENMEKAAQVKLEHDESWLRFQTKIMKKPDLLFEENSNLHYIDNLNFWLRRKVSEIPGRAALKWSLLGPVFGDQVANNFRDALLKMWRHTTPELLLDEENENSRKGALLFYSYVGIGLEAHENPKWAERLSDSECERALQYAVLMDNGFSKWFSDISRLQPKRAYSAVREEVVRRLEADSLAEWQFLTDQRGMTEAPDPIVGVVFLDLYCEGNIVSLKALKVALGLLGKRQLNAEERTRLQQIAKGFFKSCDSRSVKLEHLGMLFLSCSDLATTLLEEEFQRLEFNERNTLAVDLFGGLLGELRNWNEALIEDLKSSVLQRLIVLALRYVPENNWTPSARSKRINLIDRAESAQRNFLSSLHSRNDNASFKAVLQLSKMEEFGEGFCRWQRRMAREIAERASESRAWTEAEIVDFGKLHRFPITTSEELWQFVISVLENIRFDTEKGDFSSKYILQRGFSVKNIDENSVQHWLAEQLRLRAGSNYQVYREPEVARKKEPDIVISSKGKFEVAIEVKEANSWSIAQLKTALEEQLIGQYLLPESRRHGVLFLIGYDKRKWKHPQTKKMITFSGMVALLNEEADRIPNVPSCTIGVKVFGIHCDTV